MTTDARRGAAGFATVEGVAAIFAGGVLEAALQIAPTAVSPGHAVLEVPLWEGTLRPDGRPDLTLLGVLVDCGAGIGVFSVGGGTSGVTAELRVEYVGVPAPQARALVVEGTALRSGPGGGQAAIRLRDDLGTVVALGSGLMARTAGPPPEHGDPSVVHGLPVTVLGPDRSDGPDRPDRSDRPARFDGSGEQGEPVADVLLDPMLTNSFGAMHGGVVLGLVQEHQERRLADLGRDDRHTSLAVEYLRPVRGEQIVARTTVVRASKRFCSLRTELLSAAGSVLVRAHGLSTSADLGGPPPRRLVEDRSTVC